MALIKIDFRLDRDELKALAKKGKDEYGIDNLSQLVRMAIRDFLHKKSR